MEHDFSWNDMVNDPESGFTTMLDQTAAIIIDAADTTEVGGYEAALAVLKYFWHDDTEDHNDERE